MKRILPSVFAIAALLLTGSVFAQTGSGTTDQTGTTAPSYQSPPPADQGNGTGAQPATDTPSQPASDTTASDTTSEPAAAPAPADTGSSKPASEAGTAGHSGSLPATASNNPLMALIGVLALGAFAILLVVRRRGAAQS
jgi:LPXTG-motif cell wall-anchored protein